MSESTNLYEQERRAKLQALRDLGVDPYGGRTPNIQALDAIKKLYRPDMGHDGGPAVTASGRIMLKRDMGKLSFLTLRDDSGDLQVALDKRRLSDLDWKVRDLIDLGDILVASGNLGVTNKGEITIWAQSISIGSKALLPPPAKWEGLEDVEARYRHRYVDLWANPEVMRVMKMRIRIVEEIRRFLAERGFIEVETPMMQTLAGGAAARPFVTHHKALDIPLFMRIAPELYLKRLLVGGMPKVFEINRNFRNEGISPRHNPEFTMLEAYEAFGSWETMADLVEGMVCHVAQTLFGGLLIEHKNGRKINLARPWRRVRMTELVEKRTGWKFDKTPLPTAQPELWETLIQNKLVGPAQGGLAGMLLTKYIASLGHEVGSAKYIAAEQAILNLASTFAEEYYEKLSPAEQLVAVYEKAIEPELIDPCYVTHVPSAAIPLARKNREDDYFADVYELAINGVEISPGYSELNDPEVQARNFAHQIGDEEEQQKSDEDFLTALKYGMPPAGGMGMGIDRLVMMLTGAESIRDVILFPLMRPHGKA